MLKERLKKISTKILYIIFAVIVSIALWLYVEITENDIQVQTISGIGIVLKNEDVLRNKNFLVTSIQTDSLSFTVEAARSDLSSLSSAAQAGTFFVEVDLAAINSAGIITLAYEDVFPSGIGRNSVEILARSPSRITLVVDRFLERQIPVKVNNYTGGTASDDLVAVAVEFDPLFISVRGPEDIVSRIDSVRVPIIIENLASTYTDDLSFILVNEDNEELDADLRSKLELSQETIRVTIPKMILKDVTLSVNLFHGSSTSDANTSWSSTPAVVKVMGDPEVIKEFNNITLGTIDMFSFGLEDTFQFPIIIPIPDQVVNISGETFARVHVEVLGQEIAHRSTSNLQTVNEPAGYRAEILTQSLDVRLRGLYDDLLPITSMNIRVVADLADMGPGPQRVPARIYIDGVDANIDPVGEYVITVTITAEPSP